MWESTFAMRRVMSAYGLFLPLTPWTTAEDATPCSPTPASTSAPATRASLRTMSAMVCCPANALVEVGLALLLLCLLLAIRGPSVLDVAWYWAASYCLMMIFAAKSMTALAWWLVCPEARVLRARATRTLRRTSLRYISQNSWHSSLLLALGSRLLTWMPSAMPTTATPSCETKTRSICAVPMCDGSFASL